MNSQYVLLTSAKDEEVCIEEVIQLVIKQTILPVRWMIIDDGSSDQTASIIEKYAIDYPFIKLQSAASREGRNFGSQYKAIQAAYELVRSLDFDFVAVQDADQAPEQSNYYETLLIEFDQNPKLGMASGFVYERPNGVWESRQDNSEDSTAGSSMFRRACFEKNGGYTPLKLGGSDWLAQINTKMNGWQIMTRPDLHLLHYRPSSSAGGILRGRFRQGLMDASFGSHPVFEFIKCCRRMLFSPPWLIGGIVRYAGFLWWHLTKNEPLLSPNQVEFLRNEQLEKLKRWTGR